MPQLHICTFNVKNDNLLHKHLNIREIYKKLINDYQIDILCTQEMIESTLNEIQKEFPNYHVVGDYRYGNNIFSSRIKRVRKFNESNHIISSYKIEKGKTTSLPWFPRSLKELYNGTLKYKSTTPRIVTEAVFSIFGKKIRVVNTHLDSHLGGIQKLQFMKLESILKKSKLPVILTGDFNTTIEDKNFQEFIKNMNKIGLKRIDISGKTFKKAKNDLAIDHIFIPKDWQVKEIKIIDESFLKGYSDHYPVIADILISEN